MDAIRTLKEGWFDRSRSFHLVLFFSLQRVVCDGGKNDSMPAVLFSYCGVCGWGIGYWEEVVAEFGLVGSSVKGEGAHMPSLKPS